MTARTSSRADRPLRVGVVGLGFGAVHAAAFRQDPRCRVVALCGTQLDRTRDAANKLDVPHAFSDWREILQGDLIDVVSLAVPAPLQTEVAAASFRADKHVFLEKPLAGTYDAALPLRDLAGSKLASAINFEFAELEVFREARRLLHGERIGPLRHATVTWRVETYANKHELDSWKTRARDGGGALNLFGSHSLYYLGWLLGPITSIWATLSRAPADARAGDTHVTASLRNQGGVPIALSIAVDAFQGSGHRIELYGRDGTIVLENTGSDYISGFRLWHAERTNERLVEVPTIEPARPSGADGRIEATASIVRRFVDAIESGQGRVTPGLLEGLEVQKLIDAARRSDETGCRVELHSLEPTRSE